MIDIAIVEDHDELSSLLKGFLEQEGYSVQIFDRGEKLFTALVDHSFKLIILDIMLPTMNGFEICRKLREEEDLPILILSAKVEKEDKLNGLILGADDYIEKPYDIDLLLAKIRGIFKRRYEEQIVVLRDLKIDKKNRSVTLNNQKLNLTVKEYDLLLLLLENRNKVLRKEFIFNQIWGFDSFSEPQTLTVHIKWLREKIERDPKNPKIIKTIWGIGYLIE